MSLDLHQQNPEETPQSLSIEEEDVVETPKAKENVLAQNDKDAALSGYLDGVISNNIVQGISTAETALAENKQNEEMGLNPTDAASVVVKQKRLEAEQDYLFIIDEAINASMMDESLPVEERAEEINQLLRNRQESNSSIESYSKKIAAYAQGGDPSMLDLELLADSNEQQLINMVFSGVEERLEDLATDDAWGNFLEVLKQDTMLSPYTSGADMEDLDTMRSFVDNAAFSMLLPLNYGGHYQNLYQEVFPERFEGLSSEALSRARAQVIPGEVISEIKHKINDRSLPIEERKAIVQSIFDYVDKSEGLLGADENTFAKSMMLSELLGSAGETVDFDWDRLFGNVTGVLDATVIASPLARGMGSFLAGRRMRSVQDKINAVNPDSAAQIDAAAMSSPELQRAMNRRPDEIIGDRVFPVEPGTESFRSSILPYLTVEDFTHAGRVLSPEQKEELFRGIELQLKSEYTTGASYVPSASSIRPLYQDTQRGAGDARVLDDVDFIGDIQAERGFVIDATYSAPSGNYFTDANEAFQTGLDLFPAAQRESIRVYEVRGNTFNRVDDLESYTPVTDNPRYVFRVNREYEFNTEALKMYSDIGIPSNTARQLRGASQEVSTGGNPLRSVGDSAYIRSASSLFDGSMKRILDDANVSEAAMAGSRSALNKPFKDMNKLPSRQQDQVLEALSKANADGGWHSNGVLMADFAMNPDQIKAYRSIAELEDFKYQIANRAAFNKAQAQGYQTLTMPEGIGLTSRNAKVIKPDGFTVPDNMVVRNVDEDSVITVSNRDELRALYEDGSTVAHIKRNDGTDEYVLVPNDNSLVQLRPLDPNQLPYTPGYFSRIDQNNFFVTAPDGTVIASAKTQRRASELRSELISHYREQTDNLRAEQESLRAIDRRTPEQQERLAEVTSELNFAEKFVDGSKVRYSRELAADTNRSLEELKYESMTNQGLIFGTRGSREVIGRDLADPVMSSITSSDLLSSFIVGQQFGDTWRTRFFNSYGDMLGLRGPDGNYSWPTKQKLDDALQNVADAATAREIKNVYSYINRVEGINESTIAQKSARAMLNLANQLESIPLIGRSLSDTAANMAGSNPLRMARSATFFTLVASRPMRQALMQSMQPLMILSTNPTYMMGRLPLDYTVMTSALVNDMRNPGSGLGNSARLAKAMGVSESEFKSMYKGLNDSGLLSLVDQHAFSRDAARTAGDRYANRRTAIGEVFDRGVKDPLQALKKVGFDVGEYNNMVVSYLATWNRLRKENPNMDYSSAEFTNKAVSETQRMTLGMAGRSNTFAYQDGILSLPMQFMSILHKSALAWLPARLGGDTSFTNSQKLGMAFTQFSVFGTDGLGLTATLDRLLDGIDTNIEDPKTRLYLKGGLFDYMLINGLGVTGSASFAPASAGNLVQMSKPLADIVAVGLSSPEDSLSLLGQEFFGASGETYSRVVDVASTVNSIFSAKGGNALNLADWTELNTQDVDLIASTVASITTQGSDFMNYRMMQNLNSIMSANAEVLHDESTPAQRAARVMFGMRTLQEDVMNDLMYRDLSPSAMVFTEDTARNDASAIVEVVRKQLALSGWEGMESVPHGEQSIEFYRQTAQRLKKIMPVILSGYEGEELILMNKAIEEQLTSLINKKNAYSDNIVNFINRGMAGEISNQEATRISNRLEEFALGLDDDSYDKALILEYVDFVRTGKQEERIQMMEDSIRQRGNTNE